MMTPILTATDRLLLREFEGEDWRAVHAYRSNPEVKRYELFGPNTEAETRELIARALAARQEEPRTRFHLAVVQRADGLLIGEVVLIVRSAEHREAEIGFMLHPDCWGQGYATEAAHALLLFGFRQLGLHRIAAECLADNEASAQVLTKIGMRLEGRRREIRWLRDRWCDSLLYAVLAHEWAEVAPQDG